LLIGKVQLPTEQEFQGLTFLLWMRRTTALNIGKRRVEPDAEVISIEQEAVAGGETKKAPPFPVLIVDVVGMHRRKEIRLDGRLLAAPNVSAVRPHLWPDDAIRLYRTHATVENASPNFEFAGGGKKRGISLSTQSTLRRFDLFGHNPNRFARARITRRFITGNFAIRRTLVLFAF
jgi:hypothetical protein